MTAPDDTRDSDTADTQFKSCLQRAFESLDAMQQDDAATVVQRVVVGLSDDDGRQ